MGICSSSQCLELIDAGESFCIKAEKELEEANKKIAPEIKVLLLGAGDSGKTTFLKQMHLIHNISFSHDIEYYRQLILDNLTGGVLCIFDAMLDMHLAVSQDDLRYLSRIQYLFLSSGEPFPMAYLQPLKVLWRDPGVQEAWHRGNEAALPENLEYFFSDLDRLFDPQYQPTEQDIIQCRVRTIGITGTVFHLQDREVTVVDVGGQRSERRKWIHCFRDATSILFFVSLSGYDQCLFEDKDANQMYDALVIWEAICRSPWFERTSIILFLNKDDLFEQKLPHSDIEKYFPDFDGEPGDVRAGREYFKHRFSKLAVSGGKRDIYIHVITATNTAMLRAVIATAEGTIRSILIS
ncbi:heterotrimeric G protein alpha subunit 4 [Armillaria novae-zelandiae]|uniref:Heterotrimeric G protein alpha subunit 4 n=1 Tax=Armillaria novae-zelandiae TaxID=153914 RepID=A0AA39NTH9_9AGAR|nr:heterotrimeric G protein alpha subunit 4 [Armillaria novae-zelandiae]